LTDIHRSSGEIVKVCHEIKAGRTYTPATRLDLDAETPVNLIHIECSTPEKTMVAVKKIMCERMPLRILNGKPVNPVEDVMVLSPVNTKGQLSCLSLNRMLRQELNPEKNRNPAEALAELKQDAIDGAYMKFRIGDKVIQTKNTKANGVKLELSFNLDLGPGTKDEIMEIRQDIEQPTYIVNGDMGYILEIAGQFMVVKFSEPDRYTTIPLVNNELLHAYCITCHRAQGSESPVVIIPVHRQFNLFMSNSWLYTALSRGKQIVITCGAFDTVERAIRNRSPNNRKTRLKLRLIQESRKEIEVEFAGI
jgi:exodeoxyribonuclease V alpha subunit